MFGMLGVALRAGLLRAPLPLGLPSGKPLRALHIPNAELSARLQSVHTGTESVEITLKGMTGEWHEAARWQFPSCHGIKVRRPAGGSAAAWPAAKAPP